jgi:hypothetical protein
MGFRTYLVPGKEVGVCLSAIISEDRRDPAIATPAEPFGQADNRRLQGVLIVSPYRLLALVRTVLADHTASPAFGDAKLFHHVIDRSTTARRA